MKGFFLTLFLLVSLSVWSQVPSPAKIQKEGILLANATIHNGRGVEIKKASLFFESGIIKYVGPADGFSTPEGIKKVIDLKEAHIYPGFIALDNTLGLAEIGAVRASRDHSEIGEFNPSVRTIIAYNTDSDVIPTVRSNGVLLSQPTPSQGTICGQSSIVQLDAWNWEDAIVKEGDGIFLNYPDMFSFPWWMDDKQKEASRKKKTANMEKLKSFFADALAYNQSPTHPEENLKLKAMGGIFDGSKNLYIRVDGAKLMIDAVQFARESRVKNIVIRGGREAYVITDFLKENDVSVILGKMHSTPSRAEDDIDLIFKLPGLLKNAGISFCISYDRGATGQRNLPFVAGSSKAYGLSYEDAISAISYDAAKIAGIDDTYGSLEEGKSATLFVSEGDALDMKTNNVTLAFIDGRAIDLNNKQTELAKKFSEKYGIE
jgi:imidazolonepropionase-like amidohydrolase